AGGPGRWARRAGLRAGRVARPERARPLGGCRFMPWRGRILVLREPEAASAPVRLEPGANLVWDRRFAVNLAATAPRGFTLGYLGPGRAPAAEGDLPRLIYSVLPALWDEDGLAAAPHLGWRRADVRVVPRVFFRAGN